MNGLEQALETVNPPLRKKKVEESQPALPPSIPSPEPDKSFTGQMKNMLRPEPKRTITANVGIRG